jgi:hypothetical protein
MGVRGIVPVKFLLDMGISPETGMYLTKLGHDAVHLIDEAMGRCPCKNLPTILTFLFGPGPVEYETDNPHD